MKLVTFEVPTVFGSVNRIGAVDAEGQFVDLQASYTHWLGSLGAAPEAAGRIAAAVFPAEMVGFIGGGAAALDAARQALDWAASNDAEGVDPPPVRYDPAAVRLRPPVPRPPLLRDFMAFETHLKNIYPKLGREIPPEWYTMPVYYKGNPGSLGAHGEDVPVPAWVENGELDYEFELALVIGTAGKDIPRERALDHVFGYMIYNDFSERVIQAREMSVGLGPAKGKDFHNAHVFGPCLVTKDEIADPYDLAMTCRVNGEVRCEENSGSLHWRFEDLIAHASRDEGVAVGEIFGTGTVGNGSGAERGEFLKRGDVIELEVAGLGTLRNRVV